MSLLDLLDSPVFAVFRSFLWAHEELTLISSSASVLQIRTEDRRDIIAGLAAWINLETGRAYEQYLVNQLFPIWD